MRGEVKIQKSWQGERDRGIRQIGRQVGIKQGAGWHEEIRGHTGR